MWSKIKFVMSGVWGFLNPIINIFMSKSGEALADIALSAVYAVATTDMTNSEKRDAAFKMILENMKAKGLEVTGSVINLAIEAALQKLKESEGK